jgi:formate-dependent nitrite reductase membrane component NrfD
MLTIIGTWFRSVEDDGHLIAYVLAALIGLLFANLALLHPHLLKRVWPRHSNRSWLIWGHCSLIVGFLFTALFLRACTIGVISN